MGIKKGWKLLEQHAQRIPFKELIDHYNESMFIVNAQDVLYFQLKKVKLEYLMKQLLRFKSTQDILIYLEKIINRYFIQGMGIRPEKLILVFDGGISTMKLPEKLKRSWKVIALHRKKVDDLKRKMIQLELKGGRENKIKVQQRLIIESKRPDRIS
jgi:uncharacterized protein (DUF433 family)